MADYSDFTIRSVLQEAGSDRDLELFSVRLLSEIEGITYLPTSTTYDLNTDGRATTKLVAGEAYIVASAQKERLPAKADRDLKGLLKRRDRNPGRVSFCFSHLKSEDTRRAIERAIGKQLPQHRVRVYGIDQLVEHTRLRTGPLEQTYPHALAEIQRQVTLTPQHSNLSLKEIGYRVLLGMQLSKSAAQLRFAILRSFALELISMPSGATATEIAASISEALELPRAVQPSFLTQSLEEMVKAGDIIPRSGKYFSTRSVAHRDDETITVVLQGVGALQKSLQKYFDDSVSPSALRRMMPVLRDGLAELFHRAGLELVDLIHRIGDDDVPSQMPDTLLDGLHQIGHRISLLEGVDGKIAESQVLMLLPLALLDRETGARDWLARLSLLYASACCLGLHPDALARLEQRIKKWRLIPDTRVLLSMVGAGEEDHRSVRQMMQWWKGSGGVTVLIGAFVQEFQRHADIARSMVEKWTSYHRLCRGNRKPRCPDENVFLRSILKLRGEKVGPSTALQYVSQFDQRVETNLAKVVRTFRDEYGMDVGASLQTDEQLIKALFKAICHKRRVGDVDDGTRRYENAIARCRTDALSLGYLACSRQNDPAEGTFTVILSPSTDLNVIAQQYPDRFGTVSAYIDPDRLLFILSANPGTALSIASIEAVLFGGKFETHVRRSAKLAGVLAKGVARNDSVAFGAVYLDDSVDECLAGG